MLIGSYSHLVIEGYITLPDGVIIEWGLSPAIEGYITLPDGVIIEWGLSPAGKYTGGEFDTRKIIFPKPMKYPAFWGFSSQIAGNNRDNYYYGYLSTSKAAEGTGTALAADYMCITAWNGYDYRWIAIGC